MHEFHTLDAQNAKAMKEFHLHPNGSHLCMWDDRPHFFPGVIKFIKDVDGGRFS